MASTHLIKEPHYEQIIRSHHHELEGIYLGFIDNKNKEVEYSELIPISNISIILNNKLKNELTINSFSMTKYKVNIDLSRKESRFFDLMNLSIDDYSKDIPFDYTLQISDLSDTTKDNILKLIKSKQVFKSRQKKKSITKIPKSLFITRPLKKSHRIDQPIYSGGTLDDYETVIIYKYMDPVIRMVCEYMILLDQYFKDASCYPLSYFKTGDNQVDDKKLMILLSNIWEENKLKEKPKGTEGSICVFGVGKIDCCSETLKNEHLANLAITLKLFNLEGYSQMIEIPTYKNIPLNELSLPSAVDLLRDQTNLDYVLLVKIMQKTIDEIITKSGREESSGAAVHGQTNPYPRIHLLEVLDPANTTWILRSERYHLSRSPCVHNGLQTLPKIDYFLNYLNLWDKRSQLEFEAVSWLHTIGHALDRLYCGHTGHTNTRAGVLNKNEILQQIKNSFKIFIQLMPDHKLICGIIPCARPDPDYINLFYYISMNDFEAIANQLIKMPIKKLKFMLTNAGIAASSTDRAPLIELILGRIRTFFVAEGGPHNNFPFFNINFSYNNIASDVLTIAPKCSIKTEYGCKPMVTKAEQTFLRQ